MPLSSAEPSPGLIRMFRRRRAVPPIATAASSEFHRHMLRPEVGSMFARLDSPRPAVHRVTRKFDATQLASRLPAVAHSSYSKAV